MQTIPLDNQNINNLDSGTYLVSSDDPRYFALLSMPNIKIIDSRSAEDGIHRIMTVKISKPSRAMHKHMSKVSNPPETRIIPMSPKAFASAKREYQHWQDKWWREAFQNSVDAGATDIVCQIVKLEKDGDIRYMVTCEDNGKGMDRDTLLDKFLTFGESGKENTVGSTGGFGKAKELLLLPWINWSVWTGDILIRGKGNAHTEEKAPYDRKGTAIIVTMGAGHDDFTSEANAISVISRSYLPNVKFTINKKVYYADLIGDKTALQPDTDKAELYVSKKPLPSVDNYGIVRVNGLYMHTFYIGEGFDVVPIIEITASSIEVLSLSRDDFRDLELRGKIDKLIRSIMVDKKSSLRKKENLFVRKYKSSTRKREKAYAATDTTFSGFGKLSKVSAKTKEGMALTDDALKILQYVLESKSTGDSFESAVSNVSGESATAMMEVDFASESEMESAVKTLVWEPDFYIENEIPGYFPDPKFFPETMKNRIYMLAKAWTELVRFVLIQLGYSGEFIVGWIFSKDAVAAYKRDDDGDRMILLNPFKFVDNKITNDNYVVSSDTDLQSMYASAIHECTHMVYGITYHDEAFASAITRAFAKCIPGVKKIQRIVKGIKKFRE